MFKGFFVDERTRRVPYLRCDIRFPEAPHLGTHRIELLVDTGADRTTISRTIAEGIGLDLSGLPDGGTSTGFGGVTAVRMVESNLSVEGHTVALWLRILESRHPISSALGRDFMANFALFIEERTGRVLFLDQTDVETYGLATLGNP